MLEQGLGLSCLHWPTEYFTLDRLGGDHLPHTDIKQSARDVPLRYKYRRYFWQLRDLPAQIAWWARLRAAGLRERVRTDCDRHITLEHYD
jgi:hypothetical protein